MQLIRTFDNEWSSSSATLSLLILRATHCFLRFFSPIPFFTFVVTPIHGISFVIGEWSSCLGERGTRAALGSKW